MKYILSLFIVVASFMILSARTRIYSGLSTNRSDCLATVMGIMKYAFIAVLIRPYQNFMQIGFLSVLHYTIGQPKHIKVFQ